MLEAGVEAALHEAAQSRLHRLTGGIEHMVDARRGTKSPVTGMRRGSLAFLALLPTRVAIATNHAGGAHAGLDGRRRHPLAHHRIGNTIGLSLVSVSWTIDGQLRLHRPVRFLFIDTGGALPLQ